MARMAKNESKTPTIQVLERAFGLLDVLGGLETIKICTAYKLKDGVTTDVPTDLCNRTDLEPVYEELPDGHQHSQIHQADCF